MSVLKTLMFDTKSAWVEYPGLRGFEVEIANLSRPEMIALRKRCVESVFDRKTRVPIERLNEDKFVSEFTKASVKNWRGLKIKYLEELLLVNIDDQDPDADVPFSLEDAEALVSNSGDFDSWLNENVFDLQNFRSKRERGAVEEA